MCTLHLFFQVFPEEPVLFAANRDEILDRAWRGPELLSSVPRIWGPRDLAAGGTWMGVNEAGVLVSLANHEGTLRRDSASLCSRGAVVLETLRHGTAEEARRFAEWAAPACKAYTLLVADPVKAFVVDHAPEGTQAYRLMPGFHVITNARFRDPADPKARRSRERMEALAAVGRAPDDAALARFLSDHERPGPDTTPLCIHPSEGSRIASRFGTSSASVIRIGPDRTVESYRFASGPPCRTPLEDATPRWEEEITPGERREPGAD
ncbi:MAG: NRDE family protein [Thermodesulfobacteriota bacterium]